MKFIQSSVALIIAGLISTAVAGQEEEACLSFTDATVHTADGYLYVNGTGAGDSDNCNNDLAIITLSNDDTAITVSDSPYTYSGNKCVLKVTNWDDATKNYDGSYSSIILKASQISSINCDNGTADNYALATNATITDTTSSDKAEPTSHSTATTTTTTKTRTRTKSAHKTTKKTTRRKTTTKKKSSDKSSGSSSSNGIGGIVTFFTPDTGACGKRNSASDYICALGGSYYGSYSKKSKYCGREILIKTKDGKRSVKVTVEDACESCPRNHIDLSPAAFAELGDFDKGILDVVYEFL